MTESMNFSTMCLNVNGIRNKSLNVSALMQMTGVDAMAITEIKLDSFADLPIIPGCTTLHALRNSYGGGGCSLGQNAHSNA